MSAATMFATPLRRVRNFQLDETYFKCLITGREYRRVVGGLAWPFESKSGYAVVLGETRVEDPEQHQHRVFVIGETEAEDFQELLSRVSMLQDRTLCKEWMTPMRNKGVLIVDDYNEEHRYRLRKRPIELATPPMFDDTEQRDLFRFYDRLLARRTNNRKTFHFGRSKVAHHCSAIQPGDLKHHIEEYPPVAACLYALAEMDINSVDHKPYDDSAKIADSVAGW